MSGGAIRGMGSLLAMLRSDGGSTTTTVEEEGQKKQETEQAELTKLVNDVVNLLVDKTVLVEETLKTTDFSKLNRKERRLLAQKQAMGKRQAPEEVPEEVPVKIPKIDIPYSFRENNPTLILSETSSFTETGPKFGFSERVCVNNYLKLVKFSPCGQYLASTSQDRCLRTFAFDQQNNTLIKLSTVSLGDVPYEATFHPCGDLVATSAKYHPIHLWNMQGGREASYRGINHLDELDSAQSVAFSPDGLTLYAGYKKCIRLWDVRRPGKHMEERKTWKSQPYKDGLNGIICAIAVHPTEQGTYALGSHGDKIAIYSRRSNNYECMFGGDFKAVTDLKYSSDGTKLFSAGRKTGTVLCWDLRNPGKVLFKMTRPFDTNQKVYFSIDRNDNFLFSGTSSGEIVVFDLQNGSEVREPISSISMGVAAVPAVSAHPTLPIVAACTGERIFPYPEQPDDDDVVDDKPYHTLSNSSLLSNSIQLWNF